MRAFFKPYRELQKSLGHLDAFVEFQELTLRELGSLIKSSGGSEADYIRGLSEKHQIRVDFRHLPSLQSKMGIYYILIAFSEFEVFVFAINHLLRETGAEIFSASDKIQSALGKIDEKMTGDRVWGYYSCLLHCYRALRNIAAHPFLAITNQAEFESYHARALAPAAQSFYGEKLGMPNYALPRHDQLSFDDFMACTRLLKEAARYLSVHPNMREPAFVNSIAADVRLRFSQFGLRSEVFRLRSLAHIRTKFCLAPAEAALVYEHVDGVLAQR